MNEYDQGSAYENYDSNDELSPYELLMQMQSWNKAIYLRIENAEKELQTQFSLIDGEIRQEVTDFQEEMSTLVSTTAAGIRTEMVNADKGLTNQILTTAEGLRASMVDADNKLSNQITTTAAGINATISDTNKNLSAHITATAQGLASKVSNDNYNGQKIASLITQDANAINLIANKLNLSGYVTFSSLGPYGNTVIDGSRIQTGYIAAERLDASVIRSKVLQAGGISADYIQAGTLRGVSLQSTRGYTSVLIEDGGMSTLNLNTGHSVRIGNGISVSGGGSAELSPNYLAVGFPSSGVTIQPGMFSTGNTLYMYGSYNFGSASVSGLSVRDADYAVAAQWLTGPYSTSRYQPSDFAQTRTSGLGFGFSTASGYLYVSLNGTDRGSIKVY